jgi:MoxR-like ATPase
VPDDVDLIAALEKNVARCIVGKPEVVRLAVVGLLARGHLLIEDVPGVGKTTLAAALARSIGGRFARIQFTADMLPSDVIGVSVWDAARGEFAFKEGPVFANVVLADEINRTAPKTQSSLLEAMNEAQVSLDHTTYTLPSPFMVLATQNPREYEGTYALPESQLDRFLLRVRIGYPDTADEKAILRGAAATPDTLAPALALDDVRRLQTLADTVSVADLVIDYVMALVSATRESQHLALGVSPRGARALVAAARAAALADARDYVVPDDVKALAVPALAHRVIPRGGGAVDAESIVRAIVQDVAVPR